jgi:RHS repeat-associated protein
MSWEASSAVYDYAELSPRYENPTFNGLNQDITVAVWTEAVPWGGYDQRGNLTNNDPSRAFGYDIDNHLISISGTTSGALEYDPLGRLSKTTINGVVTSFLYDGVNLIGEYDGGATLTMRYLHALGVDQPWVQFAGSGVSPSNAKYLIANYQGSIIALADSFGYVVNADIYRYGPWGEPKKTDGTPKWSGSRFMYTGQTVIPGAELYYYKARVYDPAWGRFLQTDPIGSKDDLDLYAYVGGDPINGTDPSGTQTFPQMMYTDPATMPTQSQLREVGSAGVELADQAGIALMDPNVEQSIKGAGYLPGMALRDFAALARLGRVASTDARAARLSANVAERAMPLRGLGANVNRTVEFAPAQLQAKFKHAADFGVSGNYNKGNAALYEAALQSHVSANTTLVIPGSYRGGSVTHFVDPGTGLNVMRGADGGFVSGWKLSPAQLENVMRNGKLGGS